MGANEVAAVFEELFESVCFQRFVVVEVVYYVFIQKRERRKGGTHSRQSYL